MRENNIKEKIDNIEGFSGIVSIKECGQVFYQQAYGFADIVNERENNINTRFGIASGAKIFTAIAICKLVDEGKLSFSSLVKEYIDMPNYDDKVTIEQLLTHTSGIPDYFDEDVIEDFSELWEKTPMYLLREPKDFIPLLKEGKMKFSPGERFDYNNAGFVALSLIVEKVSQKSFKDFVQENIFNVLEMRHCGYFAMDMLPKNCAYGYEEKEEGILKTNIYSIPVVGGGDGGVFVTVDDISKLWNGLLNYKVLSEETTKKLLTPQVHVT